MKRVLLPGLLLVALLVVAVPVFNVVMNIRAAHEAERIAHTEWGDEFQTIDYDGEGTFGVLLFHGLHGTPHDFKYLLKPLEQRRIHHYAPMLGGDRPSPATALGFTADSFARHADQAYEHLARRCDRILVVGFSVGGLMATDVATRRQVVALAVVSPAYRVTQRWYLQPSTEAWIRTLSPVLPLLPKALPTKINDPVAAAEYRDLHTVATPAMVALLDYAGQVVPAIGRIDVPILCILSRGDEVVDANRALEVIENLPVKSKRIVWCERSNHSPLLDHDRDLTVDETVGLIDRLREP